MKLPYTWEVCVWIDGRRVTLAANIQSFIRAMEICNALFKAGHTALVVETKPDWFMSRWSELNAPSDWKLTYTSWN